MMPFLAVLLAGMGGGPPTAVTLTNLQGASHTAISPSDANVIVRVDSDGHCYHTRGSITTDDGLWLLSGSASAYEVRFTKTAGADPTTGTLNTWMALSTDRSFRYLVTTNGYDNLIGTILVEIRRVAGGEIVASSSVVCEAVVEV